jgi:hypothetical protein
LLGCVIEVTEAIGLDPIDDDRKQQMPTQMSRRRSLKHAVPSGAQSFEVETAQMRDLVLNRGFSPDASGATFLSHRIKPLASRDRQPPNPYRL